MTFIDYTLIGIAAMAGGAVNALAGGGTLITFPMLTAVGVPAVAANVTNTVSLCPGYLGASIAQFRDLKGQTTYLWLFLPLSVICGAAGGYLLLITGEQMFRTMVPYLILFATAMLAVQDKIRGWVMKHTVPPGQETAHYGWKLLLLSPAAIYGGYFGAGAGVIILATLGLIFEDSLTKLNALKQTISFGANTAAAVIFLFSDQVAWPIVPVMAIGAMIGGSLGGRLAGRISPILLRRIVVAIGLVIGLIYLVR